MANRFSVINGDLYNGGIVSEMKVISGSDARIKASGTGSCKVVGKLTANGDATVLSVVRLSDCAVVDTISDNEIYAADVSGLYSISVANASGFTNVWATILA